MRSSAPAVLTSLLSLLCGLVWSQKPVPPLAQVAARNQPANARCWYPNYRCSITPENLITGEEAITVSTDENPISAKACYQKCQAKAVGIGEAVCSHFTKWTTRGVTRCYLLKTCDKIYDDWCTVQGKCTSGPADCSNQADQQNKKCDIIPKPDADTGKEPWQCENGGDGTLKNGYTDKPVVGNICYQTCNSWQSKRWLGKGSETKGFLKSACEVGGTYATPTTNDNEDELVFPKPPTAGGDYPKPDAVVDEALSCDCQDIALIWPAPKSASAETARHFFYYNPRYESGASMQCENEVTDVIDKFPVTSDNVCRFFCDDYLVATVKCVNGDWTGEVMEKGLYCYKTPKMANELSRVANEDKPTNGY